MSEKQEAGRNYVLKSTALWQSYFHYFSCFLMRSKYIVKATANLSHLWLPKVQQRADFISLGWLQRTDGDFLPHAWTVEWVHGEWQPSSSAETKTHPNTGTFGISNFRDHELGNCASFIQPVGLPVTRDKR